ncbi:uncharacterized protein FPRO_14616 [Fusarium proliferatum ET1]|uniref:Uncharacterized protein n=1 Tax=Fusarium proliferatum (strain ET1) TaxID=1227346 RepID=A0A1L7VWQ0_FUSPR|nr:uncharacterized protein FPRO_14616 [Fusarium proliferatum ET1]CZR44864.1 uncharacterized protein FPRO_14616 [Fusarium proliferatum ET1]
MACGVCGNAVQGTFAFCNNYAKMPDRVLISAPTIRARNVVDRLRTVKTVVKSIPVTSSKLPVSGILQSCGRRLLTGLNAWV